jgi:CheY-like chemotaxis protein
VSPGNGGTGLGLSIVRQLLRLHAHSTLEVSSAGHGQGTLFEMRVNCLLAPAQMALTRAEERASEAPPIDRSLPRKIGYRVLHAEDDAFVRMALPLRTFKTLGVEYEQVEDGLAALEAMERSVRPFDCVVLDNQMPGLSGAATARKLRSSGYTGLIVGMTGDVKGCDDRNEFEASGLTWCTDKDSLGLEELVRQICLHAAELHQRDSSRMATPRDGPSPDPIDAQASGAIGPAPAAIGPAPSAVDGIVPAPSATTPAE